MAEIIDLASQHKCAHTQCRCQVSSTEAYCSAYCSDAANEQGAEIQCDCKHAPCALD
jgi:hypothetical protein